MSAGETNNERARLVFFSRSQQAAEEFSSFARVRGLNARALGLGDPRDVLAVLPALAADAVLLDTDSLKADAGVVATAIRADRSLARTFLVALSRTWPWLDRFDLLALACDYVATVPLDSDQLNEIAERALACGRGQR